MSKEKKNVLLMTMKRHLLSFVNPLEKAKDLLSSLAEGTLFAKKDISQTYAQLCLDENSK